MDITPSALCGSDEVAVSWLDFILFLVEVYNVSNSDISLWGSGMEVGFAELTRSMIVLTTVMLGNYDGVVTEQKLLAGVLVTV